MSTYQIILLHAILEDIKRVYDFLKSQTWVASATGLTRKGHSGNFKGDNNILCPDTALSHTGQKLICQNSAMYT